VDTNAVILLERINDMSSLSEILSNTAVTLVELPLGPLVARTSQEQALRQRRLQQVGTDCQPILAPAMV